MNCTHADPKTFPKGKKITSHKCYYCGQKVYMWEDPIPWRDRIKIPEIRLRWKRLDEEDWKKK